MGAKINMVGVDHTQMGAYFCIASNDIPPSVSKRIVLQIDCKPRQFLILQNISLLLSPSTLYDFYLNIYVKDIIEIEVVQLNMKKCIIIIIADPVALFFKWNYYRHIDIFIYDSSFVSIVWGFDDDFIILYL